MDTLHSDNKFLDFKLFVLPETKKGVAARTYQLFILVNANEYDEASQDLLQKIIGAMKLDLEKDVLVAELEGNENLDANSIRYKTLLSFGLSTKRVGIHYPLKKYQLLKKEEQQFLLADVLPKIAADRNLKGMLWNVLKDLK
ncbi:MAG: hypothetical protein AAGG68_30400 [Bacteroidota bacterium]